MRDRSQMSLRQMLEGLRDGQTLIQDDNAADSDVLRAEILELAGFVTITPIPLTDLREIKLRNTDGNSAQSADVKRRPRLYPPFKDASD